MTKKNIKKEKFTWPLKEDKLILLKDTINDCGCGEVDIKFVEVSCKSKNVNIYQLAARKEGSEDPYELNAAGKVVHDALPSLDFIIVDARTKEIFIDAETNSIGDFVREEAGFIDCYNFCSLSYSALAKMLNPLLPKDDEIQSTTILDTFVSCDFSVEDSIPDTLLSLPSSNPMVKTLKAMSKADKNEGVNKDLSKYRIDGFTLLSTSLNNRVYEFHKPSSVLVKSVSNKKETYFVMGVDEGTYFGCVLPPKSTPKTLDEGFKLLIPVEFRGLKDNEYLRQGEWFFHRYGDLVESPTENSSKPYINNLIWCNTFDLPKEDDGSNDHSIGSGVFIDFSKKGSFRIVVLDCVTVSTMDHEPLHLEAGLWEIRKNTAVLSVSSEGVD